MKTIITTILAATALSAGAHTLHVNHGNVTYHFNSEQVGQMTFTAGTHFGAQGKNVAIAELGKMIVDQTDFADNLVEVTYQGTTATVDIAGNIAQYIDVALDGANVTITQSELVDDVVGEITYTLQGESSDGSFTFNGAYKASVELHGLTLTSTKGAAIDLQCGKRVAMRVAEGTVNTLVDAASGSQKAALYCKGHLEFKQKGTLNVTGNKAHAISAKEYIEIKNTTINVLGAQKDGINCNQYMLVESGTITISNVADDGIQVAFKDDTNREAEDTGTFTMKGGTITVTTTGDATKCIKADGDFVVTKGTITATANGKGIWDSTALKTKAAACIGADGNATISGGTFDLMATSGGGKGMSFDGDFAMTGGDITIATTGGMLAYSNGTVTQNYTGNADNLKSDYKSSPKGIKVDGAIQIDGGSIIVETKGNGGEGIETKKTLTINGGDITIHAYEDATNSTNDTYINGGNIEVISGTGDGIDSNGNIYIAGGNIRAFGAKSPEMGLDCDSPYKIYFTGGEIFAIGGGNATPSANSGSTQAYVTLNQTVTAGQTVTISSGSTELITFDVPAAYGTSTNNAPAKARPGGGWDWGFGGAGGGMLISHPDMVSGQSYTVKVGTTTTSATAKISG